MVKTQGKEEDWVVEGVLERALEILKDRYGNLKTEENWLELFHRLIYKSGGHSREASLKILEEVYGNELVNGTILLFQNKCPVRFAFMDGQARMAAVHYYIRKLVPTMDGKWMAMSSAYSDNPSMLQQWSLANSAGKGVAAVCGVYMTDPDRRGCAVTMKEIWERRERSKECLDRLVQRRDHLNEMSPGCFSDVVLRAAGAMATHQEKYNGGPPYVLGQILNKVNDAIKFIFMWLVEQDSAMFLALVGDIKRKASSDKGTVKFGQELYGQMFSKEGNTKIWRIFPSLKDKKKQLGMPNLHLLILCLAAATTERKTAMYLEDCIEKDWIVRVGEGRPPEGGSEGEDLHRGTFMGLGNKKTWYETNLYAVR
jgi:hypothetical protein